MTGTLAILMVSRRRTGSQQFLSFMEGDGLALRNGVLWEIEVRDWEHLSRIMVKGRLTRPPSSGRLDFKVVYYEQTYALR
jgi:hypothetical protein